MFLLMPTRTDVSDGEVIDEGGGVEGQRAVLVVRKGG
jgi:hypothetical protein